MILPQLRPTTFFLSITVLINSLQVFDIINVMTRGGPLGTGTTTMVYQVYLESFSNFRAGYGATVATIMFLVLLVVTLFQVRVMDRGQRGDVQSPYAQPRGYSATRQWLLVVALIAGPLISGLLHLVQDPTRHLLAADDPGGRRIWDPRNYRTATEQIPFWMFLRNSVIITSVLAMVKFTLGVLSALRPGVPSVPRQKRWCSC